MKIGILSMQRVVNYGSFLQAYGLRGLVKLAVNENATFVDIIGGDKLLINKHSLLWKISNIYDVVKNGLFFDKMLDKLYLYKLSYIFKNEYYNMLDLDKRDDGRIFDTIIIGSDEVFNCTQNASWGFSRQLMGNVMNTRKVVTYAASFGATTFDLIESAKIKDVVIDSLNKIDMITVRDENSADIIEKLIGNRPCVFLDPVLLYDFTSEINSSVEIDYKENYIIVYSYAGRINDRKEINSIVKFAKRKKLKIYTIFCRYTWADRTILPSSPFQLFRYFDNAQYVISDTFHGTIFSIVTHSKFCSLIRDGNKNKIESLLLKFELLDKAIYDIESIEDVIEQKIDYYKVDEIRNNERKKTIKYLKECLKNEARDQV